MEKRELRIRRFVAKYIKYLTVFGYLFVVVIATAIAVLWFFRIDETAVSVDDILPQETSLKRKTEVVVLKLLVERNEDVSIGQGLVEISSDPAWIERYRSSDPDNAEQIASLRSQMPEDTVETLTAPVSGVAMVWPEAVGRILPAGWDIAKVIDFNDLRISAEFGGRNAVEIRPDQQVKVEPLATYGNKETLRTDIEYPGWWRDGRAQFNSAGSGKIKDTINRYYAGAIVYLEKSGKTEDTPFTLSKTTDVEISGTFRVAEPDRPVRIGAIKAEPYVGNGVRGTVLEATHSASVNLRSLPEDVTAEIRSVLLDRFAAGVQFQDIALSDLDKIRSKIKGGSVFSRLRSGLREDNTMPLAVLDIGNLKVVARMEAEHKGSEVDSPEDERLIAEQAERNCWAVTKLTLPPSALQEKIRMLHFSEEDPVRMSAVLKIVVGKRRIAMLLFRKN